MTHKFKVGDKVRVVNGCGFVANGTVTTIAELETTFEGDSAAYLKALNSAGRPTWLRTEYLENLSKKPKKVASISALEHQVAELVAKVEALESTQKPQFKLSDTCEVFIEGKPNGKMTAVKTQGLTVKEQRKGIIAEAKAFYTETLNEYQLSDGEVEILVNNEERSASVTLLHIFSLKPLSSGKSKCAPNDVFNADIGKAIALGRALGLDVSKFEQAVNPTEVVSGSKTYYTQVGYESGGFTHKVREDEVSVVNEDIEGFEWNVKITEDTEANY